MPTGPRSTGTDGPECLDLPPLGTVEPDEALGRIGGQAFIKGSLDSVNELLGHDREQVREIAARRVEVGKDPRGYTMSSACSVSPRMPPENVELLYEVVEEYSRF